MKSILILVVLCLSSVSFAEKACRADVEKHCAGIEKGEGRIAQCLKTKEADLSAECKTEIANKKSKMKHAMKGMSEACEADMETHCGDIEGGHGRMMKCMKENRSKFSEACKSEMKDMRKMMKK